MTSSAPYHLPLILRKDNSLILAVYDEHKAELTEVESDATLFKGDYRECEVRFNPLDPSAFAHCTTTQLHYSRVVVNAEGEAEGASRHYSIDTVFTVEMPHVVVDMAFSPRGTYLVTYAMMDPKRTPDGNLSIFDTATGKLLRRGMQARWPAMMWTAEEEMVVRPVQGRLDVMDGAVGASGTDPATLADEPEKEMEEEEGEEEPAPTQGSGNGLLSRLDLMLAQDKEIEFSTCPAEGRPLLALFKPFYKNRQATFSLFRLPNIREAPLYDLHFGRAESASMTWSKSGLFIALLVKSERDPSGKSYYGTITLHLIDIMSRKVTDVKLKGDGETVHDCVWSPVADELLVVHGKMPRNKCTVFSKHGVALMTFGEAPRNMAAWSPNGKYFVLGGSGNLAGDYQFYSRAVTTSGTTLGAAPAGGPGARRGGGPAAAASNTSTSACLGSFNEKCSFQSWAPDSYNFLCSTVFTRLRMDNKLVFTKANGARVLTRKYPILYGAHWVTVTEEVEERPERPVSPMVAAEEKPKPQAYQPPGGPSRAAALLRRDPDASQKVKPAGPIGATAVVEKKKRKR